MYIIQSFAFFNKINYAGLRVNLMSAAKTFITKLILLSVSAVVIILSPATVLASSGLVSSIGGATFIQGAKHFWVTSASPTISGITTAGAKVSGTVGSQSVSATADGSGNWSWTPSTALSGDNQVSITSGSITDTFTLTIGALPANIASSSASTLAPAGSFKTTIAILSVGALLALVGTFGLGRSFRPKN